MSFENLLLHPKVLKALQKSGYETPTEIQAKAIPKAMQGFDIRASAQTGTGKTAAFLLPTLSRLAASPEKPGRGPRALILTPTRELAMQVAGQAEKYSCFLGHMKSVCVVGGVPYALQVRKLNKPYDILIATPGRLIDFLNQGKIKLSQIEVLVLDEADRMLDMGFEEPVREIASACSKARQTLLFSATLQGEVMRLSEEFMTKPMEIVVHAEKEKHENIEQKLYYVDHMGHKNMLLEHILREEDIGDAIVFTATKRHADQLAGELRDKDFRVAALHGDMSQNKRTRTIKQIKEGKINIVVATDVAARGLDVQSITHVINFDLPQAPEDYVHRIGRTGRAGRMGTAFTFAASKDGAMMKRIEKYTGHKIDIFEIEGLEPRTKQLSMEERPRRGRGPSRGQRSSFGGGRPGSSSQPKRFKHTKKRFEKRDERREERREGQRSFQDGPRRDSEAAPRKYSQSSAKSPFRSESKEFSPKRRDDKSKGPKGKFGGEKRHFRPGPKVRNRQKEKTQSER